MQDVTAARRVGFSSRSGTCLAGSQAGLTPPFGFWAEVAAGRLGRMLRSYLHLDLNRHGLQSRLGPGRPAAHMSCHFCLSLVLDSDVRTRHLEKDPSYIFLSPISPLHASARRARYTCRSALWHVQHDLIWWIERHPIALYLDRSINPSWQSRGHQGPKQCPPGFPLPWS